MLKKETEFWNATFTLTNQTYGEHMANKPNPPKNLFTPTGPKVLAEDDFYVLVELKDGSFVLEYKESLEADLQFFDNRADALDNYCLRSGLFPNCVPPHLLCNNDDDINEDCHYLIAEQEGLREE